MTRGLPHELDLERASCALCGAAGASAFAPEAFAPYAIARCEGCGFHFLSPRPTEAALRTLYESGDYFAVEGVDIEAGAGGYDDYRAQEAALRLTFRRFLATLRKRGFLGQHLLEIGCGLGFLLDEARAYCVRREGTELAPAAAAEAAKFADMIHVGGVEAAPVGPHFDVVISNHVIEHVYDPRAFVRAQLQRLRPGGSLVATTPWMGSAWQRVMGARWPSFKLPEHVLYFDRRSLVELFASEGLVEVETLPYLHAFPLALVAAKLGFALRGPLAARSLWLPQTTLAVAGRKPEG